MRRAAALVLLIALAGPALAQDARNIDRELGRLRNELVGLGSAEQSRESEAERQRAALKELNAREAAIKTRIDANRGSLAKLLGALETYQRRPPPPLLVNPRSARDAVRAAILIKAVTPELQARGKTFAAEADALAKVRRSAAAASETLFQAESDIADHRADIDRLLTQKEGLENRLPSTDDPQARALAAQAGSVAELVGGLSGRTGAPERAPAKLAAPVAGPLVRRFGDNRGARERTEGWTWSAAPAAPVLAPAAARVDYAGPLKGWGPVVILNVGGGHRVVLAGLEAVAVGIGRTVAAGEPVGRMGPAGRGGDPPELYMEVRNNTAAVDPARWMAVSALKSPRDNRQLPTRKP
jgi:septal ring factor EnvC (AmiA/AmiB activator)